MITATDQALAKIKKQLERRGKGVGIRIGVRTTGCSGMSYVLEYVDEVSENDTVYDVDNIKIVVDNKSKVYLDGLTVGYKREGLNEGFEFINPNERDRCGCGESFRI